jgi:hypothetical protein
MKKRKVTLPGPMGADERMKYEVAEELGLLGRVQQVGWGGLSTVETGRIGGLVRAKRKQLAEEAGGKTKEV